MVSSFINCPAEGTVRCDEFTLHTMGDIDWIKTWIVRALLVPEMLRLTFGYSQAVGISLGEHRRSGGHDHRHRGGHRHSSESHPHTFSDSFSSQSEGGGGGAGAGGGGGGGGGFGEVGGHGHSASFGGGGHDAHGGGAAAHAMDATFVWKLSKLGRIGSSRLRFDDDFADRLNYQYTGVLMFLFIGLIGIRQYVGKPIQCWIPQEFTRGWEEYAENYCWVSNTYFAPIQNRLPPAPDREMLLIGYYQWAPIVMAIQAMAFYLPCLIWRLFMAQSGFNVRRILQMACDSNVLLPEHTMKNVRFIARYMEGYSRGRGNGGTPLHHMTTGGSRRARRPTTSLLERLRFRFSISSEVAKNKKSSQTTEDGGGTVGSAIATGIGATPDLCGTATDGHPMLEGRRRKLIDDETRQTYCSSEHSTFRATQDSSGTGYTLQCVLPLNMFLEKIYIFLWFWHCMVGLVTLSSFVMWFYRMGFPNRRVKFIRKYLKIMSVLRDTDKAASHKFVENYLRPDGVFLIRLIAINVGDLMAGDLACELWHIYRHKRLHEAEDQKYLDATGMLSDLVLPYEPGAPGGGDIPLNVAGRLMDKHPAPSAPLTGANNNNLSSSNNNNNDDSIV
ncbi:Innexin [Fasciola hepatica]|uniref:Innexin n=1 Tax=Fasciola hepatica TaxID=6192 RepID=A0A4E0RS88_FASHE|nr:Innexin [Fasciola hepatica]